MYACTFTILLHYISKWLKQFIGIQSQHFCSHHIVRPTFTYFKWSVKPKNTKSLFVSLYLTVSVDVFCIVVKWWLLLPNVVSWLKHMFTVSLRKSEQIPEPLVLRLVHLQGAVISGGKVCSPICPLHHWLFCGLWKHYKCTPDLTAEEWLCRYFFRRMACSPSPLTLLRTCSQCFERGAAGPPQNPRARGSRGWPCSAWRQWSTSFTPAARQSGRWRSGPYWTATSSSSTGTVLLAVRSRTGRAGKTAWSPFKAKC